jgi:serine/threonine protein kinase/Tfp pilus assembly protein PilF
MSASGDSIEKVDALNDLSEALLFTGELTAMFELSDDTVAMARRLGHARGEAHALFYFGMASWLVTRLEVALASLLEADANFRELGDELGRAKTRIILGAVYRSFGDLDQAFLEGLEPVEYLAAHGPPEWEARARHNLAVTMHELGDYDGARKQFDKVLALREGSGEHWIIGRALSGLGAIHDATGNHREALGYHLRALKTAEAGRDRSGESKALHELGLSYERLGDRRKAIECFERSLRLREDANHREAQCTTLIALGSLFIDEDAEKALGFLQRALDVAKQVGTKPRIYQAYAALSRAYEARGEPAKALEHHKAYHDVQSEVARSASAMRVKNLRTVFEAEKKAREAEIARLKESLEEGTSLGSYRLIEKLGAGGMGEVWRGEHRLLARPAAIKVIRAQAAGGPDYEQLVQRFRREAEVTASLRSPHTVELYDFGTSEGGTFHYVMELLDGMDTRQIVERFGPLPPERVVFLLRQACRSLAEAHEHNLVHRDIKPANLFVAVLGGEFDFLKVLDFGMVKTGPEGHDLQLTAAGSLVGTPAFVAPEWVTGEGPTDGRSDLYSLGCTAFWMLTGMPVFQAKTPAAMLLAHVNTAPPTISRLSEQTIPDDLEAIIRQCLEKQPEKRPVSAGELRERLGEIDCSAEWDGERARAWWLRYAPEIGARLSARPRPSASIPRASSTES